MSLLRKSGFAIPLFALMALLPGSAVSETYTLKTYYPSPYGSYQRMSISDYMQANKLVYKPRDTEPENPAVGTLYFDSEYDCLRLFTNNSGWVNIGAPDMIFGSLVSHEAGIAADAPRFSYYTGVYSWQPMSLTVKTDYPKITTLAGAGIMKVDTSGYGRKSYSFRYSGNMLLRAWPGTYAYTSIYVSANGGSYGRIQLSAKYTDPGASVTSSGPMDPDDVGANFKASCYGMKKLTTGAWTYYKRLSHPTYFAEYVQFGYYDPDIKPIDYYSAYLGNDGVTWCKKHIGTKYDAKTVYAGSACGEGVFDMAPGDYRLVSGSTKTKVIVNTDEECYEDVTLSGSATWLVNQLKYMNVKPLLYRSNRTNIELKPQEYNLTVTP